MILEHTPIITAGEALDSYVARVCLANEMTLHELLRDAPGHLNWGALAWAPDPETVQTLCRLTGTPTVRLNEATLRHYLAAVFREVGRLPSGDATAIDTYSPASWLWPRTSQLCPKCVPQDGPMVWQLGWRTPLNIGCQEHHVLLCHECPTCQAPFLADDVQAWDLTATARRQCGNTTTEGVCEQPLDEIPTRFLKEDEAGLHQWLQELLNGQPQRVYHATNRPAWEAVHAFRATTSLVAQCLPGDVLNGEDESLPRDETAPRRGTELRAAVLSLAHRSMQMEPYMACNQFIKLLQSAFPSPAERRQVDVSGWLEGNVLFDERLAEVMMVALKHVFVSPINEATTTAVSGLAPNRAARRAARAPKKRRRPR